jgi:hypothetical protein
MPVTIAPTLSAELASADAYLSAALRWLRSLLAWQVDLTRQRFGALADDEYRGLYVPDAEADLLSVGLPPPPPALLHRREELAEERNALEAAALRAEERGVGLPLRAIARRFGLSPFERDVLLLALAPEVDLGYERLFAYVQDDVTRKRPSVDLALRLLGRTPAEWALARQAFAPDAPLLAWRLIQLFDDGQRQPPLLARFIKLDERAVAALLGHDALDPTLLPFARLAMPARPLAALLLPQELAARLRQLVAEPQAGLVIALQGGYGSGRRAVAEGLCAELGLPLLSVDLGRLAESEIAPAEALRRVVREATLREAAVIYTGAEQALAEDAPPALRLALLLALDEPHGRSFLALDTPWEARGALRRARFLRCELPPLGYGEREQIWRLRLGERAPEQATLQALASTFRLSPGQIRDAAAMAQALARWRGDSTPANELLAQDLYAACRAQSSGKLDSLAHKISSTYSWQDIVLPPDQLGMLREVGVQVRHRRTVLEAWGYDRHLAMGKGVNVLFAGQSGTGKTMAAEIIAHDLGLELYKVDLSTMVSKYIGETEKNLDRIFQAAREANAILFFDEADAIFGKRSEVKDAHDRYANIEVGYLLQKMEEYDGVVILATNLRKNLDDAFVRRLHVAIDFPFPEEPDRLRIWRKVFPPEAPLSGDVDLGFLAARFKLAGGNIRNIALLAAYLAAEDGSAIAMRQIIRAVKREYQKLGKLVTESEFGPYLALLRG